MVIGVGGGFLHIPARGNGPALATTMGLESPSISLSVSTKPRSCTSSALMSNSLATQMAAVFRTYGSSSLRGGKTTKIIGEILGVSPHTIAFHLKNLKSKNR